MNVTRVKVRVTLGVLGVNNGSGSRPDGVNSEQDPDLLGVRCVPDPDEDIGFLGGVLGTRGGASWWCDWGGEDGMGSTASEANTGREGSTGCGKGALRPILDDNGCSVRTFTSLTTDSSSSSEDSLEGRPSTRLRFAFAASRRLNDTWDFLASRSACWRASASSDSRGSVAVLVRAHAGSTKFLRGFLV